VPVGEQCDEQAVDERFLADDAVAEFAAQAEKAADAEAVSGMSMKVFRGFADFRTGARAYGQRAAAEVFDKPEKVRSRDAT
jgi:hypothetical protein